VEKEVKKGNTIKGATKVAAKKTGQKEESVRRSHQRTEKKKEDAVKGCRNFFFVICQGIWYRCHTIRNNNRA